MSDLPILTLDDFAGSVGEALTVETDDGDVPLVLTLAEVLPDSAREGGAFRLEFEGPLQPELGQGIYGFQLAQVPTDIFIVPIARTGTAMRYEAVFF